MKLVDLELKLNQEIQQRIGEELHPCIVVDKKTRKKQMQKFQNKYIQEVLASENVKDLGRRKTIIAIN